MSLKLISMLKAGFKDTFHERFTTEARPAPKVPLNASLQEYKNATVLKVFYIGWLYMGALILTGAP